MKVNKISRKLIKPMTPTPENLNHYKISFLDNSLTPMNLAVLLFYQSKPQNEGLLEESLAKILVQFYPLAGRFMKEDRFVDCNDEGAELVIAEAVDVELKELVRVNDAEKLNDLYPDQYFRVDEDPCDPLMSVQATHFPCGGVVVAISVTHRIFDIPSIATLIQAWSHATNPDKSSSVAAGVSPSFPLPALIPLENNNYGVNLKGSSGGGPKIVAKKLAFDEAALVRLKGEMAVSGGSVAVSAVIARALTDLDQTKHGKTRDFVVFQPINMRPRTIPPQSTHVCGNLTFTSLTERRSPPLSLSEEDAGVGLQELARIIADGVANSASQLTHVLSPDTDGRHVIKESLDGLMGAVRNPDTNFIVFSDCTEFGFYEADFGWGKPLWAAIIPQRLRSNAAVLMPNREGDGIEAWVYLNQDDMPFFDHHHLIKSFAF